MSLFKIEITFDGGVRLWLSINCAVNSMTSFSLFLRASAPCPATISGLRPTLPPPLHLRLHPPPLRADVRTPETDVPPKALSLVLRHAGHDFISIHTTFIPPLGADYPPPSNATIFYSPPSLLSPYGCRYSYCCSSCCCA